MRILTTESLATRILADIMRFRRTAGSDTACATSPCQACLEPHLAKIVSAIETGDPIPFVLPAFPGKSPNPAKVLGPLPDMAELRALGFLQSLCDRISELYPPGARIILCSDGRVFSDVVGMREEDVTAYQRELSSMIAEHGFSAISTFNLDEVFEDLDFDGMRAHLMSRHGASLPRCQEDPDFQRLYLGITRFLFEDALVPGQTRSRTALQKESRVRAYAVIQRSKAWGDLVEERFPEAVRLSIHPQACGARKLGIRLIDPDQWQTPWHGVAIHAGGQFSLTKRAQAEEMGARLVYRQGRPSHYEL